jgi:disulfide bond formation protein DsbB
MCYWQRHAHKVIIALAALALVVGGFEPRARGPLLALTVLALLSSAALGFFHMGVEYKWWDGPKGCAAGPIGDFQFDPNDPLAGLDKKIKPPACDEAVWAFLGLSMAAWNGIASLGGALITVVLGRKGRNDG